MLALHILFLFQTIYLVPTHENRGLLPWTWRHVHTGPGFNRIESESTECTFNPHWSRPHSKVIICQLTKTLPLISRENHVQPCMCCAQRNCISRTLPPNGWSWAACCFSSAVDCTSTVAYIGPTLSSKVLGGPRGKGNFLSWWYYTSDSI